MKNSSFPYQNREPEATDAVEFFFLPLRFGRLSHQKSPVVSLALIDFKPFIVSVTSWCHLVNNESTKPSNLVVLNILLWPLVWLLAAFTLVF